jgi:hypothetical protein
MRHDKTHQEAQKQAHHFAERYAKVATGTYLWDHDYAESCDTVAGLSYAKNYAEAYAEAFKVAYVREFMGNLPSGAFTTGK